MNDKNERAEIVDIKSRDGKTYNLTSKQLKFADLLTDPTKSISDCYRAVYNCSKMKPSTINVEASKLANNPKIANRVAVKKREIDNSTLLVGAKAKAFITTRLLDLAKQDNQLGISALNMLCKVNGMYSETVKVETERNSNQIEQELLERLNRIA
jgi:hypothetical protein